MASYKVLIRVFILCFIFESICGDNIEYRLVKRFNDVKSKCIDKHKHKKPAYECSGIMIRGVANIGNGEQKYAWSKKERNRQTNAFSFAFLRKDQLFDQFPSGYESGYIIYPHMKTPKRKNKYDVLCAFPVDAYTDDREGKHGCGHSHTDPTEKSRHCDTQKIKSFGKWISHYKHIMNGSANNSEVRQCGFDTTTKYGADNFAVALQANKYLRKHSKQYGWKNNELRIQGWNENNPKEIPIEAFFYLLDSDSGEQMAKQYQRDYVVLTGEEVPIVGIRLPQKNYPNLIVTTYEPRTVDSRSSMHFNANEHRRHYFQNGNSVRSFIQNTIDQADLFFFNIIIQAVTSSQL